MATVIRASTSCEKPSGRSVRAVAFSFEDMAHRADDYLGTVRNKAIRIMVWQLVPSGKTCLMTGNVRCAALQKMILKKNKSMQLSGQAEPEDSTSTSHASSVGTNSEWGTEPYI